MVVNFIMVHAKHMVVARGAVEFVDGVEGESRMIAPTMAIQRNVVVTCIVVVLIVAVSFFFDCKITACAILRKALVEDSNDNGYRKFLYNRSRCNRKTIASSKM